MAREARGGPVESRALCNIRGWEESEVGRRTEGAAGEVGENQEQVAGEPSGKMR